MIKQVNGNLLTYPGIQVLAHQCNCLGVWGGGIAKTIHNLNPKAYELYHNHCKSQKDAHILLGTVQYVPTDDGKQTIANLFGEYSFCESIAPFEEGGKPRHTDYPALKEALHRLHTWMVLNDKETVGVPYCIGCGLAGGSWSIVHQMLVDEFEDDWDITLCIVKYK